MKNVILQFCLLILTATSIDAQIRSLFLVDPEIRRVIWYEDGEKTSSDIYHLRDGNSTHVELMVHTNESYSYISKKFAWGKESIHGESLDSAGDVRSQSVYTLDDKRRIVRVEREEYQVWGDIPETVNFSWQLEYDTAGNLVYSETSGQQGLSVTRYTYDEQGRLEKITRKNHHGTTEDVCIYTSENSYYIEPSNDPFFTPYHAPPFVETKLVYAETQDEVVTTKHHRYYSQGELVGEYIERWEEENLIEAIYRKIGRAERRWVFEYRDDK